VKSLEGLGSGTAWDHIHHGSLDFDKVVLGKEFSEKINDPVSSLEDLLDGCVRD